MFSFRMRSWRFLTLCVAVASSLCLVLAACGGSSGSSGAGESTAASGGAGGGEKSGGEGGGEEAGGGLEGGTLTVCVDPSYPPLEYYNSSKELAGFDVAAAKATAEAMGGEASFKPTSFDGILPALDSGRCDTAWSGLFVNSERTANFIAVPYQASASVIMVKSGNPENIHSPEDLSGKTVASENGSELLALAKEISSELEAEGQPGAEVQGYSKFEEAVQQLVIGRADAVITQDIEASFREKEQPGEFETAYRFPGSETFGAYVKGDEKELAAQMYEALQGLEKSGELEALAEEEGMPTEGIAVKPPVGG